jgi:hypothetical protein
MWKKSVHIGRFLSTLKNDSTLSGPNVVRLTLMWRELREWRWRGRTAD